MITHIRMKNFKSWKDREEVELAPLTGFFGANSSGKSSLLQMLLLLKQTIGSENVLFFGDEKSLVNLGDFREVIHGHQVEELLELGFGCKFQNSFRIEIPKRDKSERPTYYELDVDNFAFDVAIQGTSNKLKVDNCCYVFGPEKDFKIELANKRLMYGSQYERNGKISSFYRLSAPGRDDMLAPFSLSLEELFAKVYYLGPTRANPQRQYEWEGFHPKSIGQWGDRTIDALLSARVRQLKTVENVNGIPIEERISTWLQDMKLAHSFSLSWREGQGGRNYEIRIQKNPTSTEVTLADMGYGFSQFLPVLVFCYYAPEGSTLIFEQPGIHLHPMVQCELADLLIEVVTKRNLQILVESHSEHLLTRLQRRIAEEKISANQTALYFCRNEEEASEIERLKLDKFGNIENWPDNFFGNEMSELFAMTEAQSERRKRMESE